MKVKLLSKQKELRNNPSTMRCTIPEISWHNREPVLSVDIHPVSSDFYRLASGGGDSHILIWHMTVCENGAVKQEVVADLTRHQKAVNTVRWSPSGQYLASADDDANIIVWQLKTDNVPLLEGASEDKEIWIVYKVLRGHKEDIYDMCWSVDNLKLFSGSVDNTAILWDLQKGKMDHILDDHKGFVQGVACDPMGQFLATISTDRICRVFDISGKHVKARIHKGKLPVPEEHFLFEKESKYFHDDTFKSFFRRLEFSPDGSLLVVPSGHIQAEDCKKILNATLVFTMDNFNEPAAVLPLPQQCSTTVRFCPVLFALRPDGPDPPLVRLPYRMVFAVGADRDVVLYDTQQARPFARFLQIHYTRLTDLAWARDGRLLVASSTDGFCTLITFEEGELGEERAPAAAAPAPTPCAPEDDNDEKRSSFLQQWALASSQKKKKKAPVDGGEVVVIDGEEEQAPQVINRLIPRRIAPTRVGECGQPSKAAPVEVRRASREREAKPIAVRRQPRIFGAIATPVEAKATPVEAKAKPVDGDPVIDKKLVVMLLREERKFDVRSVESKATPDQSNATLIRSKTSPVVTPVDSEATPAKSSAVESKTTSEDSKTSPVVTQMTAVESKKAPVTTELAHDDSKSVPVDSKAVPVDSDVVIVDSEAVPVDSKAVPVDSKAVPVDSKAVPVDSDVVIVDSEAVPVDSKAVPVDSKAVPVDSKAVPVDSDVVIVDSEAVPVDSKAVPVDSKAVPVDSKAVPVDSDVVIVDSEAVPVDSKAVPVDSKAVPVDSDVVIVDSKAVPVDSKAVPVDSKAVPVDSKAVPDDSKAVPVDTKAVPVDSKAVPVDSKAVPVDSKSVPVDSKAVPVDTKAVPVDSKAVPVDSKAVPVDTKAVPVDSKAVPVDSEAVSDDPDVVFVGSKAAPVDSKPSPFGTEKSKTSSRKRKGCSSTPPPRKRVSAARRKLNAGTPPKSSPLLAFLRKKGGQTSRTDVIADEEEARDCWTSCPASKSRDPGDDDDCTEDFCLQLEESRDEVIVVSDDSCQSPVVEKKAPRRVALITLASPKSCRVASKKGE